MLTNKPWMTAVTIELLIIVFIVGHNKNHFYKHDINETKKKMLNI